MFALTIKRHTIWFMTVCTLIVLAFPSFLLLPTSGSDVVLRALVDPQELFEAGRQPTAQEQLAAVHKVAGEQGHMTAVVRLLLLITLAAGAYRLRHRHHPTKQPDMSIEQNEVNGGQSKQRQH